MGWGHWYDFLDFIDYNLAVLVGKVPAGFFVEVINGGDEVVVNNVTNPFEDSICHNVQTTKIPDTSLSVEVLAGLLPPVIKPQSEDFVIFVGNIVLYLRSAWLGFWSCIGDSKHVPKLFRIAEVAADTRRSWRTMRTRLISSIVAAADSCGILLSAEHKSEVYKPE